MGHRPISNRLRRFCYRNNPGLGFGLLSAGTIRRSRAKISIEEPGVASCRQLKDNGMASVSQLNPYQCGQCGTTNIVAAAVLYQQGTHTYSTRFHSGTTQSFSAQAVAPPRSRGYLRPFLVWGPAVAFFALWTFIGFDSIIELQRTTAFKGELAFVFLALCVISLAGMLFSLRKVVRYNREVYPRLHWNWEHTYVCRRCGNSLLISP
jgi:hypothetical protein